MNFGVLWGRNGEKVLWRSVAGKKCLSPKVFGGEILNKVYKWRGSGMLQVGFGGRWWALRTLKESWRSGEMTGLFSKGFGGKGVRYTTLCGVGRTCRSLQGETLFQPRTCRFLNILPQS